MASRTFDVGEAISAIFDDFGLSDGELSAEEGEDIYPYLGDPTLPRSTVEELARAVVEDDDDRAAVDDPDFADDDYEEESSDALTHAARLGELKSSAGELGDEAVGTESGENTEEYFPGTARDFSGSDDDEASVSSSSSSDSESTSSSEEMHGASYEHARGRNGSRGGTRGRGRSGGRGCSQGGGRGRARGRG